MFILLMLVRLCLYMFVRCWFLMISCVKCWLVLLWWLLFVLVCLRILLVFVLYNCWGFLIVGICRWSWRWLVVWVGIWLMVMIMVNWIWCWLSSVGMFVLWMFVGLKWCVGWIVCVVFVFSRILCCWWFFCCVVCIVMNWLMWLKCWDVGGVLFLLVLVLVVFRVWLLMVWVLVCCWFVWLFVSIFCLVFGRGCVWWIVLKLLCCIGLMLICWCWCWLIGLFVCWNVCYVDVIMYLYCFDGCGCEVFFV